MKRLIGMVLVSSLAIAAPASSQLRAVDEAERDESSQIMHLDVRTAEDARAIRMAVLSGYSRNSEQDVIIERMADRDGVEFHCVRLAQQRP